MRITGTVLRLDFGPGSCSAHDRERGLFSHKKKLAEVVEKLSFGLNFSFFSFLGADDGRNQLVVVMCRIM